MEAEGRVCYMKDSVCGNRCSTDGDEEAGADSVEYTADGRCGTSDV